MSEELTALADQIDVFIKYGTNAIFEQDDAKKIASALRTLASQEKKPFGWLGNDGKFSLPFDVTREQFLAHFAGRDLPTGTPAIPLYTAPPIPPPPPGWDRGELLECAQWLEN